MMVGSLTHLQISCKSRQHRKNSWEGEEGFHVHARHDVLEGLRMCTHKHLFCKQVVLTVSLCHISKL